MPNHNLASDFDILTLNSKFLPCQIQSEWYGEKAVTKI